MTQQKQHKDEINSQEDLKEIIAKIPAATDAVKRAIETIYGILQTEKQGCAMRDLQAAATESAHVSARDVVDAVAAMMLAGKATYTGNKSTTVAMANKAPERLIIRKVFVDSAMDGCTIDELEADAERQGISLDDLNDTLKGQHILERVEIIGGRIRRNLPPPPAKTEDSQRARPGDVAERFYEEAAPQTFLHPTEFSKDYERILYSSAFRCLAGVTQVFGTSEGHVFHNRLTHSIKAGRIARDIAERLGPAAGVNADVVEAAALAHDLGHPPFGLGSRSLGT
jgi:HD domain